MNALDKKVLQMKNANEYNLFLSYRRVDNIGDRDGFITELHDALEEVLGENVFMDKLDLKRTGIFPDELRDAIDNCRIFLPIVTASYLNFEERKDAGDLLIRAVQSGQYIGKTIGYFRGFGIVPLEKEFGTHYLKLVGAGEYKISISDSDVGTIARLENRTNDFEEDLKDAEIGKETVEHEVEIAKIEVNKPFEHQDEVEALQKELAEINAELDLEHGGEPVVLDNEGEDFGKLDIEILDEEDEDEAEAV